ncbi:sulfotransferase 1B1-like [Festucalex cinctus]
MRRQVPLGCGDAQRNRGIEILKKLDHLRVIKTHLPLQLLPAGFGENEYKRIYIARNAKDTLVSFYYFNQMNMTSPVPGSWEGYIQKFMHAECKYNEVSAVGYGSWYDHVKEQGRKKKENPMTNYTFVPIEIFTSISSFMRKGEVADWKNHFTPDQSAEFDKDYENKMNQINIPFKTQL